MKDRAFMVGDVPLGGSVGRKVRPYSGAVAGVGFAARVTASLAGIKSLGVVRVRQVMLS